MTKGRVRGGFNQYGFTVGILMLDTRFPRIPGDMGNAATFDFPVRHHRVAGADPDRVVRQGAAGLLPAFVEGARALEREGVGAISQRETGRPVFDIVVLVRLLHAALLAGRPPRPL